MLSFISTSNKNVRALLEQLHRYIHADRKLEVGIVPKGEWTDLKSSAAQLYTFLVLTLIDHFKFNYISSPTTPYPLGSLEWEVPFQIFHKVWGYGKCVWVMSYRLRSLQSDNVNLIRSRLQCRSQIWPDGSFNCFRKGIVACQIKTFLMASAPLSTVRGFCCAYT